MPSTISFEWGERSDLGGDKRKRKYGLGQVARPPYGTFGHFCFHHLFLLGIQGGVAEVGIENGGEGRSADLRMRPPSHPLSLPIKGYAWGAHFHSQSLEISSFPSPTSLMFCESSSQT